VTEVSSTSEQPFDDRLSGQSDPRLRSPAVLRAAAERGIPLVELSSIPGSARGGRLLRSDLDRWRPEPLVTTRGSVVARPVSHRVSVGSREDLASRTRTIPLSPAQVEHAASVMHTAHSTAPVTSVIEVDLTRALLLRAEPSSTGDSMDEGLLLLPSLVLAVVAGLTRHPLLNATIDGSAGTIEHRDHVDLGVCVSGGSGTSLTMLRGAETLDEVRVRELLAAQGRLGEGRGRDAHDGAATFAITYRSETPVLLETAPLLPGSVGALTFGAVERRPLSADDTGMAIRVAWVSYLCLTYDHRLIDGADAARFLTDVAHILGADSPA
jgi:pyruvate dehydrogenase E2 component (dihydrolipoamide acetyltransferase)